MNYSAQELFNLLNQQDECDWIEAKSGSESSHSVMETVCAYCNEPGLGGGYILLGVTEDDNSLFPQYKIAAVSDPDKLQKDFVSQCASMFNMPVRPELTVEDVDGKIVVKIHVDELSAKQKPLYFKADGLPHGAMRRVGPTDQHCTEDDMHVFYQDHTSFDQTTVRGTSIGDIDEYALNRYRALREKVNPTAEELTYTDQELLEALGCISRDDKTELNLAGLLLFGSSRAQRSYFPMLRVDYIRVPGNTWVPDPDERFTTIDMRGPLLIMVYRLMDAINGDLPKGFLLPEENPQATSTGLPAKALREAIVNALMHRSYREHRPTLVIRYDNRIEIMNPGFSLKSEEKLGDPGSETRNPFIAAVFHETNLAETKGSGIRAMRRLMQHSHLAPPTFESNREANEFTSRLLLHHFLGEEDLEWLQYFQSFNLNDAQKQALLFVREVGAIDNQTYRQMADCETLHATTDLRTLKDLNLLRTRGKGRATYYVPGENLAPPATDLSTPATEISTPPQELSTPATEISTPPQELSTPPQNLLARIEGLKTREHNKEKVENIILELCALKPFKASEIAHYLGKGEDYIKRKYLSNLIKTQKLGYTYPEMVNHPDQAYTIKKN